MLYITLILAIACSVIFGSIITLQHDTKAEPETDSEIPALESIPDCNFDDATPISDRESTETTGETATPVTGQLLVDTSHPEFIPIKVPFLCNTMPYDNLGFWNFPARMDWEVNREDRWCHADCPPGTCKKQGVKKAFEEPYGLACPAVAKKGVLSISTREKIAFLQAWLFFGALDEICAWCGLDLGQDITKTFAVDGMVTTQPLNGLPRRLYTASLSHWSGWVGASKRVMVEVLKVARYVQLIITRRTDEDEHEYTFEECLVLSSINIMLRTIHMTILHLIPPQASWKKERPALYLADLVTWLPEGQRTMQFLLEKQPLPHGWCSISELDGLDYDSKFFAYFLERPHALRDHNKCTETRCLASQTDAKTYITAHVSDDCKCSFVAIDPEKLKDSLERNQIPKIMASLDSDDGTGTITLTIVDGEELPYIAISHVWADGLGNPRENSLPHCQLLRLRNLINNLGNVINRDKTEKTQFAFWIDTLCIPVAPHLRHYRTLAIHQIRETFRDATATLVLDREIYNLDSQVVSNLEIGIRIFCGGWAKRIWTLKEAVYTLATGDSERLFFQMKKDLVEWNRTDSRFQHHYHQRDMSREDKQTFIWDEDDTIGDIKLETLFESYIEVAMTKRLPSLGSLMNSDNHLDPWPQFIRLADAVSKRSTSKQEDEPLCLTFLLDRPARNLLKTQDAEDRMAMFYLELGKIPKAVLFEDRRAPADDAESKRKPWFKDNLLQKSPFKWAFASLASLSRKRLDLIHSIHFTWRFDEDFGLGTCKPDGLHIRHRGFLVAGKENKSGQPSSFLKDVGTGEVYELVFYKVPQYEYHREIGVLFPEGFPESLETSNSAPILQIEEVRAVGENQDAHEYYGTIIGYGKISRCRENFPEGQDIRILNGRVLDMSQRWCIT